MPARGARGVVAAPQDSLMTRALRVRNETQDRRALLADAVRHLMATVREMQDRVNALDALSNGGVVVDGTKAR